MKAGFAALARRIGKLQADAPRADGMIFIASKSGMKGLHSAAREVQRRKELGLLSEPDPDRDSAMARLRRDIVAEQQKRQALALTASIEIAEPKQSEPQALTAIS
jgi:hypothetical protein